MLNKKTYCCWCLLFEGIWHNFFSYSRSHTFTPEHITWLDNESEYATNLPPVTPILSFDQIPEGCVLITYDASYDYGKKYWYLSICMWHRNGTLFRVRVAPTGFSNERKSVEGEIVSQATAVEYFTDIVRQDELSTDEYMNGVIFQGDNSTAAEQFENYLRTEIQQLHQQQQGLLST